MTREQHLSDDDSALAAEFALGLLSGDALHEARRRAGSDTNFAAEVARWRGRLAPLADAVDPVPPPSGFWSRIEAAATGTGAANDNVAVLERGLQRWRAIAATMTALAASFALILVFRPGTDGVPQRTASAPMVAMLSDEQATKVVASWDPDARQLVLAIAGEMPGDLNHSHELWIIPAGGKPRSLGTMPPDKQAHMRLEDSLARLLRQGATIAISVEPKGGSRTGAPTGPVVASGDLKVA